MDRLRTACSLFSAIFLCIAMFPCLADAQQQPGPQAAPPPPAAAQRPASQRAMAEETITVPAGTQFAVVLENGISTRTAKAGSALYFRTSFPVTQNNRVVIPVGSYMKGELLESKRPGRIKGRGEFWLRLDTLILPNGYTVDLKATPHSADSGGPETTDSEGRVEGGGGKGKDVGTVATTTATGAGIGAIAGRANGAGLGAGIGGLVGLAAVLLTRGPEAELPRGSALDIVLERSITLDASRAQFRSVGESSPVTPSPARVQ